MSKPQTKERRKSKRVPAEFAVGFSFQGVEQKGKTENVGSGGFLLKSAEPLPLGVTMRFKLEHENMPNSLEVVGRVVHVRAEKGATDTSMGVQILQIAKGHEDRFDAYRAIVEKREPRKA